MLTISNIDLLTADLHRKGYSFNCLGLNEEQLHYILGKGLLHPTEIQLYYNRIGDVAINALVSVNWCGLVKLNLGSNRIGNRGIKFLSKASWKQLEDLQLHGNYIGNEGVTHLIKGQWKNIKILTISYNHLTGEATKTLLKGQWPDLISLNIANNQIYLGNATNLLLSNWIDPVQIRIGCKLNNGKINPDLLTNLRNKFPKLHESCLRSLSTGVFMKIS